MNEEEFHRRRMFVVTDPPEKLIGVSVRWADPNDERSHAEWFESKGWDWAKECVRGFVDETGVYFYRGPECEADDLTIRTAVHSVPELKRHGVATGTPIYAGMHPGKIGERWEPRMLITVL